MPTRLDWKEGLGSTSSASAFRGSLRLFTEYKTGGGYRAGIGQVRLSATFATQEAAQQAAEGWLRKQCEAFLALTEKETPTDAETE